MASSAWSPNLKGDIDVLERVQRRASKIPITMKDLPYEERLRLWCHTTLEERRKRGDLIQIYKVLNGLETIDLAYWSSICTAESD